jgi:hypothetical protein
MTRAIRHIHPEVIDFLFENWGDHEWEIQDWPYVWPDGRGHAAYVRCERCRSAIDPTAVQGRGDEWRKYPPMQPCVQR